MTDNPTIEERRRQIEEQQAILDEMVRDYDLAVIKDIEARDDNEALVTVPQMAALTGRTEVSIRTAMSRYVKNRVQKTESGQTAITWKDAKSQIVHRTRSHALSEERAKAIVTLAQTMSPDEIAKVMRLDRKNVEAVLKIEGVKIGEPAE